VPIYEYQCPDCGYHFEQLQKISDEPIRVCPNCEQSHVRKLVSQTSFVLKGGGWYKDHYGLKGKSEGAKDTPSTTGDKPAATTPAPAATEAKPAAASTAPAATPSKKTPSSAA
jgi:putative FmdB family regulatory protein